jgi:Kae1-associated kinase Bud32
MIIARGAEAIIKKEDSFIIKERIKKGYRIKEIDEKIRRKRTKLEARIMREARRIGINVPQIIEENEFSIKMEYVDGKVLRNVEIDEKIIKEIAKIIALLHQNNIIHGDLTTSNFILKDDKIYLIDFGLSKFSNKIEDKAEDLLVFFYTLKGVHYDVFEKYWKVFEEEYCNNYFEGKKVLKRMCEILKRGRYIIR